MDSAGTSGRKYPAYTTEELKKVLAEGNPWLLVAWLGRVGDAVEGVGMPDGWER